MLCHLPLLIPLVGLLLFAFLPLQVALVVYLPLAGLSVFVGLKGVEAMRRRVFTGIEGMRGTKAVVVTAHGTHGVARLQGELWNVVAPEPLAPGDRVIVVDVKDLTALVRHAPP
jgi:membrane protein implicated in regulation of membrane protease activity